MKCATRLRRCEPKTSECDSLPLLSTPSIRARVATLEAAPPNVKFELRHTSRRR
jgi:hypothetical protein